MNYETHPENYQLRPGTTEPELKPGISPTAGVEVIKKEPASKKGPVGAKGSPRPKTGATKKAAVKK